jgi:hypothetical protein
VVNLHLMQGLQPDYQDFELPKDDEVNLGK